MDLRSLIRIGKDGARGVLRGGRLDRQIEEAKKLPKRKRLFGPFWRERELAFLYGGTGNGKSVLALQIAVSIASGQELGFEVAVKPMPVLLLDFENDTEDLVERVGEQALGEVIRVGLNPDMRVDSLIEDLCKSIAQWCGDEDCKVVIIDNITWLLDSQDKRRDASVAAELMKTLKALKDELGLAILVVGHTPKSKVSEPMTPAHLFGSSMLANYANAMVALGKGEGNQLYLIQTKCRSEKIEHDSDNVLTCALEKVGNGMLQLVPGACMSERQVLGLEEGPYVSKKEKVRLMLKEGRTVEEIEKSGVAKKSLIYSVRKEVESEQRAAQDSIPLQSSKG